MLPVDPCFKNKKKKIMIIILMIKTNKNKYIQFYFVILTPRTKILASVTALNTNCLTKMAKEEVHQQKPHQLALSLCISFFLCLSVVVHSNYLIFIVSIYFHFLIV
jgi:hypothetical protein